MKVISKILAATIMLGLMVPVSGCGLVEAVQCLGKEKLRLFNWGSYIDPELIDAFEAENNVCISYTTFSSNEEAIAKLKSGEVYDIIFPSDYGVEQLAIEGYLKEINWDQISSTSNRLIESSEPNDLASGLKIILNRLKNSTEEAGFDFLKYSVPYFWGSVGILYDTTTVTETELVQKQWNIFTDYVDGRNYAYYDSSRDGFMPAMKQLGFSMNTINNIEIAAAKQWLVNQKQQLGSSLSYVTDTVIEDMAAVDLNGEPANRYDLALMYSGDAVYAMQENENLGFFKPSIGSNIWVDGMVIHKNATNLELIYEFINFILSEENATSNSLYVGYSSPIESVYSFLLGEDFAPYASAYEVTVDTNDEIFRYNDVAKRLIDDAWVEVKQARAN